MSGHTPGPWTIRHGTNVGAARSGSDWAVVAACGGFFTNTDKGEHHDANEANAHLIAAAPDLFAEIEATYAFLADIGNQWPGRLSQAGQDRLCRLRDLICKVTGRDPQDVQDDYGNRAAIAKAQGGA